MSEPVKSALIVARYELKQLLPSGCVSWTRPESLHLTLRFLGDVPEQKLDELEAALAGAVRDHGTLELECSGLGCFPKLRFPRILWAGVHESRGATASGSSRSPMPEHLTDARREIRRRGSTAPPKLGRADLPVRRDFPPASEAMPAAGRPDDSTMPNPAGGNAHGPSGMTGIPADTLNRLQWAVSAACDPFAAKSDAQPFAGQVTLGRFRRLGRKDAELVARVIECQADQQFGPWTADEVVLFRSELRPDGARHSPIERFPLRRDCLNR